MSDEQRSDLSSFTQLSESPEVEALTRVLVSLVEQHQRDSSVGFCVGLKTFIGLTSMYLLSIEHCAKDAVERQALRADLFTILDATLERLKSFDIAEAYAQAQEELRFEQAVGAMPHSNLKH